MDILDLILISVNIYIKKYLQDTQHEIGDVVNVSFVIYCWYMV